MTLSFIFVFLYLAAGTPIGILLFSEPTGNGVLIGLPMILLSIIFGVWLTYSGSYPLAYNEPIEYVVKTVNNIDVIVIDNEIINLNKLTERGWEEGDIILVSKPKTVYGKIDYSGTTFLKDKVEPANEPKNN